MSTYAPIASQTANGSVSSLAFSSIPQDYTDLVLVFQGKVDSGSGDLGLRFNSDTSSNYSTTWLSSQAGGTSGKSTNATSITATEYAYLDSTGFTLSTINFQNYSNATTYKTVLARSGKANYQVDAKTGLWRNTNAITSITVFTTGSGPAFTSGSTFSLYGIQVGDKAQKAQGGNIVTSDGTYVYHTFTSSGAFIPSQALTVDYLVVAGGGGGGGTSGNGGGGGAGGLRSTVTATGGGGSLESTLSLTAKSYSVIVGAGGAGSLITRSVGANGNNSVFGSITSIGGGGGGVAASGDAQSGGSGGGAGHPYPAATWAGGAGTANQGYAGGQAVGYGGPAYAGAGGGGAGAVGGQGSTSVAGAGGVGVAVSISGSSITYAGGGGGGRNDGSGGAGGSSIGGSGGYRNVPATNAVINTGSGGGGGGNANTANDGGASSGSSGIVIIRYAL